MELLPSHDHFTPAKTYTHLQHNPSPTPPPHTTTNIYETPTNNLSIQKTPNNNKNIPFKDSTSSLNRGAYGNGAISAKNAQLAETPPNQKANMETHARKILTYSPLIPKSPMKRSSPLRKVTALDSLPHMNMASPRHKVPPKHQMSPLRKTAAAPMYRSSPQNIPSPKSGLTPNKLSPLHRSSLMNNLSPMYKRNASKPSVVVPAPASPARFTNINTNLACPPSPHCNITSQLRPSPLSKQTHSTLVSPIRTKSFQPQGGWLKNTTQFNINCDRFMPSRKSIHSAPLFTMKPKLQNALSQSFHTHQAKVLSFSPPSPTGSCRSDTSRSIRQQYNRPVRKQIVRRHIPDWAEKTLDAPGVDCDYNANILDSSVDNLVAIGLGDTLYLYNAVTGAIDSVQCKSHISSVAISNAGEHVAVGDASGITLYDTIELKKQRTLPSLGITSLSWQGDIVSAGNSKGSLLHYDVTKAKPLVQRVENPGLGSIIGLKWRVDGVSIATSHTDGYVKVYDRNRLEKATMEQYEPHSAVKALAWCPWQPNLLATGGETSINFWNTNTLKLLSSHLTPSQVTGLLFSPNYQEIVSSHGHTDSSPCGNMTLWKYPTMTMVKQLEAPHETPILHMSAAHDGESIATLSADENLKFWKWWGKDGGRIKKRREGLEISPDLLKSVRDMNIR